MNTLFSYKKNFRKQAGLLLVLAPVLLVALVSFSAFVIDISVMRTSRVELQNAVDSAALAAATALSGGTTAATTAANTLITSNPIIANPTVSNISVQFGTWNTSTHTFTVSTSGLNAVQVSASVAPAYYFANTFSDDPHTITATSTAAFTAPPRDIMIVFDLSPWMSFYSQLGGGLVSSIGSTTALANLTAVYNALGLSQLGNMSWTPVTLEGTTSNILSALGLTSVPYPFPPIWPMVGGSWASYVDYVKSDNTVIATGYHKKYGYITFANYLLTQTPRITQVPKFWKTPQQPLQAAKNSVTGFIENGTLPSDQVGLVTYNYNSDPTLVKLDVPLTTSFGTVSATLNGNVGTNTPGKQAAQDSDFDYAYQGVLTAYVELSDNGRQGAQKRIILISATPVNLLSNGVPWPTGSNLGANQFAEVKTLSYQLADDGVILDTVTFAGLGAVPLLQEASQITGGTNVNVDVGTTNFSETLNSISSSSGIAQIVH